MDYPGSEIAYLLVGVDAAVGYPGGYREIGIDAAGNVIHRCPDKRFPMGTYGWFDPHTAPVSEGIAINRSEFEAA